eukprot:12700781-Heterocapsa_arctica.AAC.1
MYDENTLSKRRGLVRGPNTLDQIEYVHVISKDPVVIQDRARLHYPGTSFGNAIGPVPLEATETLWHLPAGQKKALVVIVAIIVAV